MQHILVHHRSAVVFVYRLIPYARHGVHWNLLLPGCSRGRANSSTVSTLTHRHEAGKLCAISRIGNGTSRAGMKTVVIGKTSLYSLSRSGIFLIPDLSDQDERTACLTF